MLSMHGLGKLNDILYNNTKNSIRNYTDFIAEHNFGAELIRYNRSIASSIAYEPASFKRPPDFVINKNDVFFYIQMKKLSESERENKQRKLIDSIKRSFKNITIGKFVSLSLSEDFNSKDANLFSSFLRESVETLPDNTDLQFPPTGSPKIVYSLYPPNKIELQHLTVGTSGNLEWIETTGEAEQQVKNSLSKAIGAFCGTVTRKISILLQWKQIVTMTLIFHKQSSELKNSYFIEMVLEHGLVTMTVSLIIRIIPKKFAPFLHLEESVIH